MNTDQDPRPDWHALARDQVEARLATGARGLARDEARARLALHGRNELEQAPPTSPLVVLLHQFQSPLIYILMLATAVTLLLGEYVDAGVISMVLALNAVIGFTQERKAERSVRALMQLVSPHAKVVRDGHEIEIESAELVPGDLVALESGMRVPADLRLIATTALMVDESLLTGESVPVVKKTAVLPDATVLADRSCMAYTGAIVASGRGRGYVVATGNRTELGAIARSVETAATTTSPLQQRMDALARVISLVVGGTAVLGFALGLLLGHPATDMFLLAVALAVAAIPEGLPIVLTITLAVGTSRMARRRAIVRRLAAVETLGSTTVIGSDKTGTLTQNRMTVEQLWAGGRTFVLPAAGAPVDEHGSPIEAQGQELLQMLAMAGALDNEAEVHSTADGPVVHGDPTEAALLLAADRLGFDHGELRTQHAVFAAIPFEPDRQYSATMRAHGDRHVVWVKGAPERVLRMCDRMLRADGEVALDVDAVQAALAAMSARGLRVLAMARREQDPIPHGDAELREPDGLCLLGLVGMLDPPRPGVREAIAGCRRAGIRVLMITGDHAGTARAIGRELGLDADPVNTLAGAELDRLDDSALAARVGEVAIYARVTPEQKLRVVRALQARNEVVAVTGDGVNDAPALKAADIGVAMGKSGTDVARSAADIVLADDNFVSIHAAVEEGRITFDNVRKATFFLVSTGAGSIATILGALVLGWPIPFVPAQLLWLNLVTNGLQDVAMAFEPGEAGILDRPPRPRSEGILSRLLWERTALSGLVMAAGTLLVFRLELDDGASLQRAQTVALTTMVLFQVFQIGNSRSEFLSILQKSPLSNPFLFYATLAAVGVHLLALWLPATQFVLRVETLTEPSTWFRLVLTAASILVAVEIHKLLRGRPPVR